MGKLRVALVAVAASALIAGPAGGAAGGSEATTAAKKATVRLGDNFFDPRKKKVKKGTKVRFRWIGDNPHNVVKRKGPGGKFRSATTSRRGINFKKRFKKRGTYQIVCKIHQPEMDFTLRVK